MPCLTQDERFATLLGRKAHEDELEALLGAWTQDGGGALMQALQQAGVPAGVVHTNQGLLRTRNYSTVGILSSGPSRRGSASGAAFGIPSIAGHRASLGRTS
jgi:crotonobetainyl-CoA:carnitine CoA-transferase CaiB-like acyl-CoA transferase